MAVSLAKQLSKLRLPVPVNLGGTGSDTQSGARAGLGLKTAAIADAVGTVSQVGGVSTGAIMERGSNVNGEFVKYADGTMLAWVTNLPLVFGNASNLSVTWNFPYTFIAAPMVIPQVDLTNFATKIYDTTKEVYKRNVTESLANLGIASAVKWVSGDQALVTLGAIAMGRWY